MNTEEKPEPPLPVIPRAVPQPVKRGPELVVRQYKGSKKIESYNTPIISSPDNVEGKVGTYLCFKIAASDDPQSFEASSLPDGLAINAHNGEVWGTPKYKCVRKVRIGVRNANGVSESFLTIKIS